MTPAEDKRPLPSSRSTFVIEVPDDFSQWRDVLSQVKALFIRREYKQCSALCKKLLNENKTVIHPTHKTFLHFYAALSNEIVATSIHNLSLSRLTFLGSAKASYKAALDSLPRPERWSITANHPQTCHDPRQRDDPASPETKSFIPTNSALSPPFSPTSLSNCSYDSDIPKPSPLHIRKKLTLKTSPHDLLKREISNSSLSPPTPHKSSKISITTPITTLSVRPSSMTFSSNANIWLHNRALARYEAHLLSLRPMLERHAEVVEELIKGTVEAQTKGRMLSNRAFNAKNSRDEEDRNVESRSARMEKLKNGRWTRERFRSERYEELCRIALEEL